MNWFGRELARLRSQQGLSQSDLGERLGHSSGSVVSKWENGVILPYPKTVAKLEQELGVETGRLQDARLAQLARDEGMAVLDVRNVREVVLRHITEMLDELGVSDDL